VVSGGRFLAAVGVVTVAAGLAALLVPGLAESVNGITVSAPTSVRHALRAN